MAQTDFAAYFDYYINKVNQVSGKEALLLGRANMLEYLESVNSEKLNFAYAKGKWTVAQVVLHIMDVERVMGFRALSFARGEQNPLPGFDHDLFALEAPSSNYSKESLIEEYAAVRNSSSLLFSHLNSDQLLRTGIFGGNKLNVEGIRFMMAGHELHHLDVLKEKY